MDEALFVPIIMTILSVISIAVGLLSFRKGVIVRGRSDVVYVPHFFWCVGSMAIGGGTIGAVTAWFETVRIITIIFVFFAVFGSVLCAYWGHHFVFFTDTGFTHKPLFGTSRTFLYNEVTTIRRFSTKYKYSRIKYAICTTDWYISYEGNECNYTDFMEALREGYRRTHDDEELPTVAKQPFMLKRVVVTLAVIALIMISVGVLIRNNPTYFDEPTMTELTVTTETFERLKYVRAGRSSKYDTEIITDRHTYEIAGAWDKAYARETLESGEPITIYYSDDFTHTVRRAEVVTYNGKHIVAFDNNSRERMEGVQSTGMLCIVVGVLCGIAAVIVGRKGKSR